MQVRNQRGVPPKRADEHLVSTHALWPLALCQGRKAIWRSRRGHIGRNQATLAIKLRFNWEERRKYNVPRRAIAPKEAMRWHIRTLLIGH